MGAEMLATISFYSMIDTVAHLGSNRSSWSRSNLVYDEKQRIGDTAGGKVCGGAHNWWRQSGQSGSNRIFYILWIVKRRKSFLSLGFWILCHHPSIKCMISTLLYECKPKIKMNEKTLCILSYLFAMWVQLSGQFCSFLLHMESVCVHSVAQFTPKPSQCLLPADCNLALLLKMCVRFFKDTWNFNGGVQISEVNTN